MLIFYIAIITSRCVFRVNLQMDKKDKKFFKFYFTRVKIEEAKDYLQKTD